MTLTGHVTAFDHFRQRLFLIENVFVTPGMSDAELDDAYARAAARLDALVADLAQPLPYRPAPPPETPLTEVPKYTRSMSTPEYCRAVEAAREYIFAGDIFQVVLAQRFDLEGRYDPLAVYRVLRQVNPSPYMYIVRHAEATLVGSSPEPMVQVTDGRVVSRPIAGHPLPGPQRGARPPPRRRAQRGPEGAGRARDARRPRPQRRRPGRDVRHRAGG